MKRSQLLLLAAAAGLILLLASRWTATPQAAAHEAQPLDESVAAIGPEREPVLTLISAAPAGAESLRSELPRSAPVSVEPAEPEPGPPDPAAPRTARFLVVRAADGAPIAGAHLWGVGPGDGRRLGVSDERGQLTVPDLASDRAPLGPFVWFTAGGYTTVHVESYEPSLSDADPERVELLRVARLDVFVLDAEGQALEGALVKLSNTSRSAPTPEGSVSSSSDGVVLTLLFSGDDDGGTVAPRIPRAANRYGRTDSAGYAGFDDLPANQPLTLEVSEHGATLVKYPGALKLLPGTLESVTLHSPERLSLRGRVIDDATGEPLANLPLWAYRHGPLDSAVVGRMTREVERPLLEFSSGPDGRFELEDLLAGVWYIGPAHPHVDRMPAATQLSKASHAVWVGGAEPDDALELRLRRGLFVAGVVVDAAGQPIPRVGLEFSSFRALGPGEQGSSGDDGNFRIGPLEPGPGFLSVTYSRGLLRAEPLTLEAGDLNAVVTMTNPDQTSSGLSLELVDDAGRALRIRDIIVSRAGRFVSQQSQAPATPVAVRVNVRGSGPVDVCVTTREGPVAMGLGLQPGAPGEPAQYTLIARPTADLRISYAGTQEHVGAYLSRDGAICATVISLTPGQSTTVAVPPGTIALRAESLAGEVRENLSIEVGDERELVIQDP